MKPADFLIRNISQLVNPASDEWVRGEDAAKLRVEHDAVIASYQGEIAFVGDPGVFSRDWTLEENATVIDAAGCMVMPGFVDAHTHLPFAGTRQDEFGLKIQGVSYQEIARRGGGIMSSVRQTRAASSADLIQACRSRADFMLLSGTTTAEAKSGYGLDRDTEIKQLTAIRSLDQDHPLELVPTFMGAHEVPEEFRGRGRDYLDYIIRNVAPEVRERKLAEFADIFCEEGYFSTEETRFYLEKMAELGFGIKLHADEFVSNGAGALAADLDARSAEHLIAVTPGEIERLARSDTACVLLPGVSFFLRLGRYAPARELLKKGALVALGTDFNPGSSMISSMIFVFQLAVYGLKMTIEEAFNAATINSAYAIDRHQTLGSLTPGKQMDAVVMSVPDYQYLAYHPGIHPVRDVIKNGRVVVAGGKRTGPEREGGGR